jgi:hypothetical protein
VGWWDRAEMSKATSSVRRWPCCPIGLLTRDPLVWRERRASISVQSITALLRSRLDAIDGHRVTPGDHIPRRLPPPPVLQKPCKRTVENWSGW